MSPLLPILLRMFLCVASTLALASLVPGSPAAAQSIYRCVDNDGRVIIGNSQPSANCRKEDRDTKRRSEAILRAEEEMRTAAEAKEVAERQLAKRFSQGIREQWFSVLKNASGAHDLFVSGASYDEFYFRLEAISKQIEVISRQIQATRGKYARQLQMHDHNTLSKVAHTAYDALSAAFPTWRRERGAAEVLDTAQRNATRSRATSNVSFVDRANVDENDRRLREAEQQYADAKAQLAVSRDLLTHLMSDTIRLTKGEL
jgi:hypothetical protein